MKRPQTAPDYLYDFVPARPCLWNESTTHRGDKFYIDAGQNDYADTLACQYSVRPFHKPLVSTPLEWKEIKKGVDCYAFTIDTIRKRLAKKRDVWKDLLDLKLMDFNNQRLGNSFSHLLIFSNGHQIPGHFLC